MPVALVILVILLALIFMPLAFVWSLNTLFPMLAIPYTFSTWAASVIIVGLLSNDHVKASS
jgi:hypothetical protein